MDLTWLGTAGFIVKSDEGEIAFDPFLSRGSGQPSPFDVNSFSNTEAIFVGHGHFDHTFDLPQISKNTEAKIFAPGLTGQILKLRGVESQKLVTASNKEMLLKSLKVQAFRSAHVQFDRELIVSTLKRCGIKGCLQMCGLGFYPKGLVQTYLFQVKNKKILFISSAGCSDEELLMYKKLEVDFLLAPLQGHSQIQDIAARQTQIIQPKVVIPHHHDDFYPPLSQNISVDIFRDRLKASQFKGEVLEIPLFKSALV